MLRQLHRPEIEGLLDAGEFLALGHKAVVNPLKQPGHRVEHVGFDLLQGTNDLPQVAHIVYPHPLVLKVVVDTPLIHVTEGQEADHPVLLPQVVHFHMCAEVGNQVAVRKHHPLGHPCGSGGIDNGGQIFRIHGSHHLFQARLQGLPILLPGSHDLLIMTASRHLLKGKNLLERRNPVRHRLELLIQFGIPDNQEMRLGMLQNITVLLLPDGRVNGHMHRPCHRQAHVGKIPLRTIVGHRGHLVPLANPHGQKPQGKTTRMTHILLRGIGVPFRPLLPPQGVRTRKLTDDAVQDVKRAGYFFAHCHIILVYFFFLECKYRDYPPQLK